MTDEKILDLAREYVTQEDNWIADTPRKVVMAEVDAFIAGYRAARNQGSTPDTIRQKDIDWARASVEMNARDRENLTGVRRLLDKLEDV